ncbi:MAG TPA: PadR family transcriptional regulator, partial [Nitrososphaerales archaeon]|nr:PadR family transcriptional regulator [Nitrososphaerales archaeon]
MVVISHTRRWMDPQAVPRGFLRFYVLSLLSRRPEAGYSIMRTIEETTDGAWRPGPGTVYPLLRG